MSRNPNHLSFSNFCFWFFFHENAQESCSIQLQSQTYLSKMQIGRCKVSRKLHVYGQILASFASVAEVMTFQECEFSLQNKVPV